MILASGTWGLGGELAYLGGTGVPFSPSSLGASLLGWWNADRTDLLTLSGAEVASWKDVVAGYDLAQATSASRPLYSATSFNGHPGVTSDGFDDQLTLAAMPFPISMFEVWTTMSQAALAADATFRSLFSFGGVNNNTGAFVFRYVTGGVNRSAFQVGSGAASASGVNGSVDLSGYHYGRCISTGSAVQFDVDGIAGTPVALVASLGATRVRFAANTANAPANFWSGAARDLIVTAPLTAGQVTQMSAWCAGRIAA